MYWDFRDSIKIYISSKLVIFGHNTVIFSLHQLICLICIDFFNILIVLFYNRTEKGEGE